jgi:formylglycine-generating enzyme required for sulfatase activity
LSSGLRWGLMAGGALLVTAAVIVYQLQRIELTVGSVPEGAVLRVDGRGVGLTPLTVDLSPGRHLLELAHSHYVVYHETLDVGRGDRLTRQVTLEPGKGRLALYSNPRGAWVELNGTRLDGETPMEVEATSGPTVVRMGLTERRPVERSVIVLPDQTIEVTLELDIDPHGSLTVLTEPADSVITLPELDVVYTPGVRIPIGEQLIRVARAGFDTQEIRHMIRTGDNTVRLSMTRGTGRIVVTTNPPGSRVTLSYPSESGRMKTVAYEENVRLPIGRVEIRARAVGYRTAFQLVELTRKGHTAHFELTRMTARVGDVWRDRLASGGEGPSMVVIPPGEFQMGVPNGPPSLTPATVRVLSQPYAMSVYEVSVADYVLFTERTGHALDERLTDPREPARYLSWHDAMAYADWLTAETGARYRLPTEAEWEYAARAGGSTVYSFGDDPAELCQHANLADASTGKVYREWETVACDDGFAKVAPIGSYDANAFGLHDMHGNVSEWVLECGMPDYADAAEDGSEAIAGQSCHTHGFRGGSWDSQPDQLTCTRRGSGRGPLDDRGIRLVREL